ncbi:hypothetical protein M758_3G158000 [Ceratodon purpureus]|nr:hypothetical protein M758_3G158000 [Ceratodon purpureus]
MPMGSLQAFNLLGGEEAQRKEAEKKEAERKGSEKSGFSQVTGLWEHATGKKDGDRKGEKKGEKGGLVPQVGNLWDSATGGNRREKAKEKDSFRLFGGNSKKKSAIDWGPGGALGIGCGAGVGVALTGSRFVNMFSCLETVEMGIFNVDV